MIISRKAHNLKIIIEEAREMPAVKYFILNLLGSIDAKRQIPTFAYTHVETSL